MHLLCIHLWREKTIISTLRSIKSVTSKVFFFAANCPSQITNGPPSWGSIIKAIQSAPGSILDERVEEAQPKEHLAEGFSGGVRVPGRLEPLFLRPSQEKFISLGGLGLGQHRSASNSFRSSARLFAPPRPPSLD